MFGRVAVPLMAHFGGAVTLDNWHTIRSYQARLMFDYIERRRRG